MKTKVASPVFGGVRSRVRCRLRTSRKASKTGSSTAIPDRVSSRGVGEVAAYSALAAVVCLPELSKPWTMPYFYYDTPRNRILEAARDRSILG